MVTLSSWSAMVSPVETNRAPTAAALMHWHWHAPRTDMHPAQGFFFFVSGDNSESGFIVLSPSPSPDAESTAARDDRDQSAKGTQLMWNCATLRWQQGRVMCVRGSWCTVCSLLVCWTFMTPRCLWWDCFMLCWLCLVSWCVVVYLWPLKAYDHPITFNLL